MAYLSALIFQETVQSLRDSGRKALVAFLYVKKAFNTVWHEGLFVKLHQKGIHPNLAHPGGPLVLSLVILLSTEWQESSQSPKEFVKARFSPRFSTQCL